MIDGIVSWPKTQELSNGVAGDKMNTSCSPFKDYILARIHPGDAMKLRGKYSYQEGDKSYFIKYICVTNDKKNPLVRISFYGDRGVLSEGDEAFDLSVWQLLYNIVC